MTMQLVVAACHCLPKRPTSWWYVCRCVRGWGCVVGVAVAYVQPWQALEGAATPAVGDVDTEATVGGDASADVDMLEPRLPTHDAAAASAQAREDTFQALPTAAEVVASQRETRDSRTGKRRIQPLLVWYARRVVCKWDGVCGCVAPCSLDRLPLCASCHVFRHSSPSKPTAAVRGVGFGAAVAAGGTTTSASGVGVGPSTTGGAAGARLLASQVDAVPVLAVGYVGGGAGPRCVALRAVAARCVFK